MSRISSVVRDNGTIALAATDSEEARDIGARVYHPHDIRVLGDESAFAMRVAAASIGPVTIGRLEYGTEVEIVTDELGDAYQVNIPIGGDLETGCGPARTIATSRRGAVYRCDQRTRLRGWTTGEGPVLALKFERRALETQLATQLGIEISDPVVFDIDLDLDSALGRQWLALVDGICRQLDAPEMLSLAPIMAQPMAEVLISGLLLAAGHDYRRRLDEPVRPLPGVVRMAIDHMEAHADEPLTVAHIADEVGVSVRTLQVSFQDAMGTTPMRHLKSIRLQRVRADLRSADPTVRSVTEIGRRWGLTHVGRFAGEYRDAFGVTPSADLRKR